MRKKNNKKKMTKRVLEPTVFCRTILHFSYISSQLLKYKYKTKEWRPVSPLVLPLKIDIKHSLAVYSTTVFNTLSQLLDTPAILRI